MVRRLRHKYKGEFIMKKQTMNDFYEDGSNHEYCPKCGYCKTCGDCEDFGCIKDWRKKKNDRQKISK